MDSFAFVEPKVAELATGLGSVLFTSIEDMLCFQILMDVKFPLEALRGAARSFPTLQIATFTLQNATLLGKMKTIHF